MRVEMMKSASGWLLTGACIVCWESATAAQPGQKAQTNATRETIESRSTTKPEPVKVAKPVVLAKSTNAKAGPAASAPAKPLTAEEKKAVSRCWKRLMAMVREANHVQRAKN